MTYLFELISSLLNFIETNSSTSKSGLIIAACYSRNLDGEYRGNRLLNFEAYGIIKHFHKK